MTELQKQTRLQWRRFLATDAGRDGLLYLREMTPGVHKGLPHEVQYDAGFTQGYMKALDGLTNLISLAEDNKDIDADNH